MQKLLLFPLVLLMACGPKQYKPAGDALISVFTNEAVNYIRDSQPSSAAIAPDSAGVYHLMNGRLLMKQIKVPKYERNVTATVILNLKSAGDPWNKAGSLFIMSNDSEINFISILQGYTDFPTGQEQVQQWAGIKPSDKYKPVIELMRFVTPYGVGYYSDSLRTKYKPAYIDTWENGVVWEQDVSKLFASMNNSKDGFWIGLWIDTYTPEGYTVDLKLDLRESQNPTEAMPQYEIVPLLNTVNYIKGQEVTDVFATQDVSVEVIIPAGLKNAKLYYIATGHGDSNTSDQYTKQENMIFMDGNLLHNYTPWRADCASLRRFNPSSGVWLVERTVAHLEEGVTKIGKVREPVASSDLSRSGWCPGSDVEPVIIDLGAISSGSHKFTFSIPKSQPMTDMDKNHWLVSAYLVLEM